MRVINKANHFYIEGINQEGYFWVDMVTLRVNEEKTARLLGCIENTLSVKDANKALWYWKQNGFPNKDF